MSDLRIDDLSTEQSFRVTGKWTEIYLKQGSQWVMIGVSGRPDNPPGDSGASA